MQHYRHRLRSGTEIVFALSRRAKKNIILRVEAYALLRISVPPAFGRAALAAWLRHNEAAVAHYWQKSLALPPAFRLPEQVWLAGKRYRVCTGAAVRTVIWNEAAGTVRLPEKCARAAVLLAQDLWTKAQNDLPARLIRWSEKLRLTPRAVGLSRAKTFWGVCRPQRGIRLNWRLVGAPDWVADYVCIHELCHLVHTDHSADFWNLVQHHTPHTAAAKSWLKRHGAELFALPDGKAA